MRNLLLCKELQSISISRTIQLSLIKGKREDIQLYRQAVALETSLDPIYWFLCPHHQHQLISNRLRVLAIVPFRLSTVNIRKSLTHVCDHFRIHFLFFLFLIENLLQELERVVLNETIYLSFEHLFYFVKQD